MSAPTQPLSDEALRKLILEKLERVWRDGNSKEFATGNVPVIHFANEIMELIHQDREAERQKHEGIGAYLAVSMLLQNVGYLLVHSRQANFPSMTAKVIANLYGQMQQTLNENGKHMRLTHKQKEE
jgi:hypothetical protein